MEFWLLKKYMIFWQKYSFVPKHSDWNNSQLPFIEVNSLSDSENVCLAFADTTITVYLYISVIVAANSWGRSH